MNLVREIKCIMCLIKCSKYLYYAKKALCVATILVTVATVAGMLMGGKCEIGKKMREMM